MTPFTDTHTHLDLPIFSEDVGPVVENAARASVTKMVCVGTSIPSTKRCIELSDAFPDKIFPAAGIHPNYCEGISNKEMVKLHELAALSQVKAIGETGLDFHHKYSERAVQEKFFRCHIELALELGKPLIVHGRKADERILEILDSYPKPISGIRHCFDSSWQVAREYIERGFLIAFGGLMTKEGHKKLKKAARSVPEQNLLLETDCPYISPAGVTEKRNEPAFLVHVAKALAELRGLPTREVAEITRKNAALLGF